MGFMWAMIEEVKRARARVNGTIRTESELSAKERSTSSGSLTFLNPEVSECTYILNGSCHKKPVRSRLIHSACYN